MVTEDDWIKWKKNHKRRDGLVKVVDKGKWERGEGCEGQVYCEGEMKKEWIGLEVATTQERDWF